MNAFRFQLLILLSFTTASVFGDIRHVPAEYATIQTAIDAADEGDTVLVEPGVYRRSISLEGKSLTIASHFLFDGRQESIDATILDGQTRRRGMTIIEADENLCVIKGFTIINGFSNYGAGIYANASWVLLEDIKIRDCSATREENAGTGGGIYCTNGSNALIQRVIVEACSSWYGGGVGVHESEGQIFEVNVSHCYANYYGSGCQFYRSEVGLHNSTISENVGQLGSAFSGIDSEINVDRTLITGNISRRGQWENFATIYNINSNMTFDHVTIVENTSQNNTDILFRNDENMEIGFVRLTNSIFWHGGIKSIDGNGAVFIQYCIADPRLIELPSDAILFRGNINGDPRLGEDFAPGDTTSPCVDAGDPGFLRDEDGSRNDIGAFYLPQPRMVIDSENIIFGILPPGERSSRSVTISNVGAATLRCFITQENVEIPFEIDWEEDTLSLAAGDSHQVEIVYAPEVGGFFSDTLVINSDSRYFPAIPIYIFAEATNNVGEQAGVPATFSLSAFPNPFNSSVTISFSAGGQASPPVKLAIYDISGRHVATFPTLLARGESKGGSGSVTWDASSIGAGVYFVRLEAGGISFTQKLLSIR